MPASRPRSRGARVHPRPCQGCEPWPRTSAASRLVLATQKLDGITGRGTVRSATLRNAMRIQLIPRAGYPDFLDLPWREPLDDWDHERLVVAARGIGTHVV